MKKIFLVLVSILFFLGNCDTRKDPYSQQNLINNLLCYNYASCPNTQPGFKFGIVGDSWTDLLFGVPLIETLRVQLEQRHGYRMVGATQGGQTLARTLSSGLHLQTIDEAGASIRYMIVSLGGNDFQGNPRAYITNGIIAEKTARFEAIRNNLKQLILSGNQYKKDKFGGNDLKWFVHGYDYISPDNFNASSPTSCRQTLIDPSIGFTNAQFLDFATTRFDQYNEMIRSVSLTLPNVFYVDLRGTLGGGTPASPFSNPSLMFDCIHPTTVGFIPLTEKFVFRMKQVIGDDK